MISQQRRCPSCPTVPVVSTRLAAHVCNRLAEKKRMVCLTKAMEWLLEKHPGIGHYERMGDPVTHQYTNQEKDTIGPEAGLVAGLPCPFFSAEGDGCVFGGLGPKFNAADEAGKQPYSWLPTLVAIAFASEHVKELADREEIAAIKVSLLNRNRTFYTPADVEHMRASNTT